MSDYVQRSQYDSPFKHLVVGAIYSGRKIREAARLFEVPEASARRWWTKYKKTGATHNSKRSGHPQKLTRAAKKKLVANAVKHRRLTLRALGNCATPKVSGSTARRILAADGYHRRVAQHEPYISPESIQLRLDWAHRHESWRMNHWEHIIWSDECYVQIGDNNGRVYVTRRPNEIYDPHCTIKTFTRSSVRVMVWACIAQNYKGPLLVLEYPGGKGGGMNTDRYIDQVLSGPLPQVYKKLKASRRYIRFQQDNAPCHVSKRSMRCLAQNGIMVFEHPPSSPDLNPIENLWHILKDRIRDLPHQPTSISELKDAVKAAWDSITLEEINNLVFSMPHCVQAVLAAEGGETKY